MQKSVQQKIDGFIEKVFLWAVPESWQPNWFTYFRIATVPVIYWLLVRGDFKWGIVLFLISASTDFIDGALARTRNQITELGKIIDPIADKLLIATVLVFIGFDYLIIKIFVAFIAFEIISTLSSAFLAYKIGRNPGSNIFGKIKMILQCLAVSLFMLGIIVKKQYLVDLSIDTLTVALVFAVLSAYRHLLLKFNNILKILGVHKTVATLKSILKRI